MGTTRKKAGEARADVAVALAAEAGTGQSRQQETLIKALPIKGLQGKPMPLEDYIALMQERARSEERQRLLKLHQRLLQTR